MLHTLLDRHDFSRKTLHIEFGVILFICSHMRSQFSLGGLARLFDNKPRAAVQPRVEIELHVSPGLLAPLAAGGAAIIPAGGKFSATTHWRDAVEHQATFYTAVPTMHQVCPQPLNPLCLYCKIMPWHHPLHEWKTKGSIQR